MKFLPIFAVVALAVLTIRDVNASCPSKRVTPFSCPKYAVRNNCFAEPCKVNPCADGAVCCDDLSAGCDRHCFVNATFTCPKYETTVQCFASPCLGNPCGSTALCCEDLSTGCNKVCFERQ